MSNYRTMRRNARRFQGKSKIKYNISSIIEYTKDLLVILCAIPIMIVLIELLAISLDELKIYYDFGSKYKIISELKSENIDSENIVSSNKMTDDYNDITTDIRMENYSVVSPTTTSKDINNDISDVAKVRTSLGEDSIETEFNTLIKHDLPSEYYSNLDFSSFQPYMGYQAITNKSTPAYDVVNNDNSYTDESGFRRHKTNSSQFTINGQDDYIIALGTFYKDKGLVGNRYLVVTSNGMYTATTGDEKADEHTDSLNMFTMHSNGTKAGIIEWIVDEQKLDPDIKRSGTITIGGPYKLQGEILYIYEIV